MLTRWKIASEAAPLLGVLLLTVGHARWGWVAFLGLLFTIWVGLTIWLWVSEAELRAMAAEGYVEGEPLLMFSRVLPDTPPREVTYVGPAYGCHWVRLGTVNICAESSTLRRPISDLKGTEAHLPS